MMINEKEFPWPSITQPDDFARRSPRAQKAHEYFQKSLDEIQNKELATLLRKILSPLHSADTKWLLADNKVAQKMDPELCEYLTVPTTYDIWWGAPAAADNSHHCYPGGWLMHNATNLHALHMLKRTAQEIRDTEVDWDAMLAGMILHDCLKPQLLLWENGIMRSEKGGIHHIAALAEGYLHGMPPKVLLMLAGVHTGWWISEEKVKGFLERAAELIGEPKLAYIPPHLNFLPETWVMRQGEAGWYAATRFAVQEVKVLLRELLEDLYPPEFRKAAEWWVFTQCDELSLLRDITERKFENTVMKVLSMEKSCNNTILT